MLKKTLLTSMVCWLATFAGDAAADLVAKVKFDIAPQQLSLALLKYSEQSGVQISSPANLIKGKSSAGVVGTLAAREGLEKLLKGTDLTYDVIDKNTILVRAIGRTSDRSPLSWGTLARAMTVLVAPLLGMLAAQYPELPLRINSAVTLFTQVLR